MKNNDAEKIVIEPSNEHYDKAVETIKDLEERDKTSFEVTLFLFALISGFLFNMVANFVDDFVKGFGNPTYTIFRIVVSSVAILIVSLMGLALWRFFQLRGEIISDLLSLSKKNKVSSRQKSYKIKELIVSGNWEYKVANIKEAKTLIVDKSPLQKETAIGKYILIYLSYKNIGKENFEIKRLDFSLVDTNGSRYESDDLTYELNRLYKLTPLNTNMPPNVERKSILCFDITPETKPSKLLFKQAKDAMIELS